MTVTSSPSEEEVTITRMLDKVLRRSDALDKESLCIIAGQRVSEDLSLRTFHHCYLLGLASTADSTFSC